MFLSQENGKLSLSDSEIANRLHIDRRTVINYNNELRDKGILTVVQNKTRDIVDEGGCRTLTKIYDIKKYFQCIAYVIKHQQKQINENTQNINDLQQKYNKLEKVVNTVIAENKSLTKENRALKEMININYTKHYKDDIVL